MICLFLDVTGSNRHREKNNNNIDLKIFQHYEHVLSLNSNFISKYIYTHVTATKFNCVRIYLVE